MLRTIRFTVFLRRSAFRSKSCYNYDDEELTCTWKLTENCQFNLVHVCYGCYSMALALEPARAKQLGDVTFAPYGICVLPSDVTIFCCFNNTGSSSYTEASEYIRYRFESVNRQSKEIYSHFTNATDTTNVDFVFDASMSIVLQENLKEAGIYWINWIGLNWTDLDLTWP